MSLKWLKIWSDESVVVKFGGFISQDLNKVGLDESEVCAGEFP